VCRFLVSYKYSNQHGFALVCTHTGPSIIVYRLYNESKKEKKTINQQESNRKGQTPLLHLNLSKQNPIYLFNLFSKKKHFPSEQKRTIIILSFFLYYYNRLVIKTSTKSV
jgi:hypothetical protein